MNMMRVGAICGSLLLTGAVPEPGAWALMIMGFGAAGAMVRRRRAVAWA
ncbi:MAG: PEPxxWA-CTERM sorting domain-containing protein [Phenylobacterium sp.]|nr:PEPxxWA-CTERM sorting domain-containing protein [Phenylobacterium sp.]